jgi:hypothetical protein
MSGRRGGLFQPDTPVSAIMEVLFDLTDDDRADIAEVERMSDEEVAREAAEIRARLRGRGEYVVGPP